MPKKLLMIPGPIEVAPEVLSEMNAPMEAHYGEKWTKYYNQTINMVREVMGTNNDTFLHVGSGHAAIETVVGSLVEEGDEILVLSNGFFGERIATIVESYNGRAVQFKAEWGQGLDPVEVDSFLEENHHRFKAVMMVHHETSTGVRNQVQELNKVVKKYELVSFVDGVCSVGVTDFKMDEWGIDFSITASQKGLGAPPGLAVISVSEKGWKVLEEREKKPAGWYLNLLTMREFATKQKDWQPYGITMAVNNVKALNRALINILDEGLENRIARHNEIAKYFRTEVRKLGLEIGAPEEVASNNITVIYNPPGMETQDVIDILDEEYDIRVANGLGKFAGEAFRVGHMNLGANKNCVVPVINALKELINKN